MPENKNQIVDSTIKSCFIKHKQILIIIFILLLFAGPFLQLGTRYHHFHNADSIMLSIMSIQNPSVFYWSTDRWLMTLPAVNSIFKNPGVNLFMLTYMKTLLSLAGIFLLFSVFYKEDNLFLFSCCFLIISLFFNRVFLYEYFSEQSYGTGLFFAALSLYLSNKFIAPGRLINWKGILLAVCSGATAAAAWFTAQPSFLFVIFGTAGIIEKTYGFKNLLRSKFKQIRSKTFALNMAAWTSVFLILFFYLRSIASKLPKTEIKLVGLNQWLKSFVLININFVNKHLEGGWLVFFITVIALIMLIILYLIKPARRKILGQILLRFFLPVMGCAIGMSGLSWIIMNKYFPRYIILSWLFIPLIIVILTLNLLKEKGWLMKLKKPIFSYIFLTAAIVTFLVKFGINKHMQSPISLVNNRFKLPANSIKLDKCIAMVGNYWQVWPRVWLMNALYPEQKFYGIAYRSDETSQYWYKAVLKGRRICFTKNKHTWFWQTHYFKGFKQTNVRKLNERWYSCKLEKNK